MASSTKSSSWQCLLELDSNRRVTAGDRQKLIEAIGRGADLRAYTEWLFEEHIAPDLGRPATPDEAGMLQEVIDFRETITFGREQAAGVTTLRQAILPIAGFNPTGSPRMSFFMYDVDGHQACANLVFDANGLNEQPGRRHVAPPRADMPKMGEAEQFDAGTTGPSVNFIYDFERYRYFVRDDWEQVLSHDENGNPLSGSFDALHAAHHDGCELKIAIRNPLGQLTDDAHEIISCIGTSWVHTQQRTLEGLTHPLVRLVPARPMRFVTGRWDVAWIFASTNGQIRTRRVDPYTRRMADDSGRLACRWFVR